MGCLEAEGGGGNLEGTRRHHFHTALVTNWLMSPFHSLENEGWEWLELEPSPWRHSNPSNRTSVMQSGSL